MSQLLQWVGTFASIISVPLAIYFYVKSMDGKYKKVRKELLSLFSSYIGTGNKLTCFYLKSVINAKIRENNIKSEYITEIMIVEDLIVEIISNPLLSNDAKNSILCDLETLIYPTLSVSDAKLAGEQDTAGEDTNSPVVEHRENLAEALKSSDSVTINESNKNRKNSYSQIVSEIVALVSVVAGILSVLISTEQVTEIFSVIDLTNPVIQILAGIIISVVSSSILYFFTKIFKTI